MKRYFRPARSVYSSGFTLIETMIVIAVIGILAAGAYPSYSDYVKRSHRASAQGLMADLATRQHQYFLDTRRYASTLSALRAIVPDPVAARYELTLEVETDPRPGFRLSAIPTGGQRSDKCGSMTVDAAGAKTPVECW